MEPTETQVEDLRTITTNIIDAATNLHHLLANGYARNVLVSDRIAELNGNVALLEDLAHEMTGCMLMFGHPEECVIP